VKAADQCREDSYRLMETVINVEPGMKTVQAVDELSNCLCSIADPANFLSFNHPDREMQEASMEAGYKIGGVVEELNNKVALRDALAKAMEHSDKFKDEETQLVGALLLRDFDQCGLGLTADQRTNAVSLHSNLLDLSQQFMQNCGLPGVEKVGSLPDHCLETIFPNQTIDVNKELKISSPWSTQNSEAEREAVWKIYFTKNLASGAQLQIVDEMLSVRHQLATIYGYESWAERSVENSFARNPENIERFLQDIITKLDTKTDHSFSELLKLKKADQHAYNSSIIYPWDENHYINQKFIESPDAYEVSEYLTLANCMSGICEISERLFGYTLTPVKTAPGEIWNSDVVKIEVQRKGQKIGTIYCDLFGREDKVAQDCHYTVQCSRKLPDGTYQLPIVVVSLNFRVYAGAQKIKLTFDQAKTLFHEFGHAIHSVSGRTDYQHVSGTRCQTDIAEVPSILNEFFFEDDRVVQTWAKTEINGKEMPIPLDLWHKFTKNKPINNVIEQVKTCERALWDQKVHGTEAQMQHSALDYERQILGKRYGQDYVDTDNTAEFLRFNHLNQYDAKFYSYTISTAIASRIWDKLFKDDPFSKKSGEKYYREFLRYGGAKDPRLMYTSLLGEEVDMTVLANAVVNNLN